MEEQIRSFLSGLPCADPDKKTRSGFFRTVAVLILSLIVLPLNSFAASGDNDIYSPDNILNFAKHLSDSGEYFRAWTELRRLESYYPGYISPVEYRVSELYMVYKSGTFAEVPGCLVTDGAGCADGVILADSLIKMKKYDPALSLIRSNAGLCQDSMLAESYARSNAYISIVSGDVYTGEEGMLKPELEGYRDLIQYREQMNEDKISPALAALLGIIPGAGYIYAGDRGTGFTAMAVIAVCGAVTYGSFANGIEPLGILSGAVTLFFYGGNIAGGYLEARRYNREVDDMIENKTESVLDLDADVERIYIRFGISSNGK